MVTVRLFAAARQVVGADTIQVKLPESATVAQLRQQLVIICPQLEPIVQRAMFAVNTEYADDQQRLAPDDTLACIPPVSGG